MGLRGRASRLGRRARPLRDHLHGVRARRARRCTSRRRRTSRPSNGAGSSVSPEDKNAALLPERVDGQLDPASPADDRLRRHAPRDRALALDRSRQLEPTGGGAAAARRRLVGLAADRDRAAAPEDRARLAARSTTASRRRSAARSTASGSRCSISRSRRACCGRADRLGLRPARAVRAAGRRGERDLPLRPVHDTAQASSGCTTAPRTRRSASRPRSSTTCSTPPRLSSCFLRARRCTSSRCGS